MTMKQDYRYYKLNDEIYRVHIEQDDMAESPRSEYNDANIGHMMCWHRRYNLGDHRENSWECPADMMEDLIGEYYTHSRAKSFSQQWKSLERKGYVCLPLCLYDHSGITMSTAKFSCPWDSGQVGWIYTTKEEVLRKVGGYIDDKGKFVKCTAKNWRQAALRNLEEEVRCYDMYLQGEVYGLVTDKWDSSGKSWIEDDSCWGFYSDKYGDDLIREIVYDGIGNVDLLDSFENLVGKR